MGITLELETLKRYNFLYSFTIGDFEIRISDRLMYLIYKNRNLKKIFLNFLHLCVRNLTCENLSDIFKIIFGQKFER